VLPVAPEAVSSSKKKRKKGSIKEKEKSKRSIVREEVGKQGRREEKGNELGFFGQRILKDKNQSVVHQKSKMVEKQLKVKQMKKVKQSSAL